MSSGLAVTASTIPWFAWIALVAIVCGCLSGLVKMYYDHQERLEMIRQGMHPDARESSGKPPRDKDF